MTDPNNNSESPEVDLSQLQPTDFDGHTSFSLMNAEERLLWLSNAASFILETRGELKR